MRVHLDRAMALVLHDLEVTGAPLPRIEDSDWQTWPTSESVMLHSPYGGGTGVWVDTALSETEQVAMLADQVQEWIVEDRWAISNRATNWPPCPEHPHNHPMTAIVHDGTAIWVCPTSKQRMAEIGRLAP